MKGNKRNTKKDYRSFGSVPIYFILERLKLEKREQKKE